MRLRELLRDVEILASTADGEREISGVCYDSRAAAPGMLFVAIRGYAADGHRFIPMAAERGAAAVLCEEPPAGGLPYIQVADSRLALALAARNWFGDPASKLCVVGVTGTNGKTTSTLLLKAVLERCAGAKVGLIGTNSNWIGDRELPTERTTPESWELQKLFREMLDAGCTHVVMEVSSHALALRRVAGIRFAAAVFTNLTQDHLDFHETMEAYAAAKAKLFSACGAAVLTRDDPWYETMAAAAACPVSTFGLSEGAALRAVSLGLEPDRVSFTAVTEEGESVPVALGIPGRFTVYNALGVLECCRRLGLALPAAAEALGAVRGVRGRVERVPTDGDYTILIDYAHTPDALENVLKSVRETAGGRVVALFGCGGDRDRTKRPIMGRIGTELSDWAVITSDNPRTEDPEAILRDILAGVEVPPERYAVVPDRREAIALAIERHRPGDVIVLAGKGHETYQEINHVKYPMDEQAIVAELLDKRRKRNL